MKRNRSVWQNLITRHVLIPCEVLLVEDLQSIVYILVDGLVWPLHKGHLGIILKAGVRKHLPKEAFPLGACHWLPRVVANEVDRVLGGSLREIV